MANVIADNSRRIFGGGHFASALFFCVVVLSSALLVATALANDDEYDRDAALQVSQSAIGNTLGNYTFRTADGEEISLDVYRGKPLLISMIFTSCHHICPTTTKHIDKAARSAQEVLGDDDTPDAMRAFARQQDVRAGNWQFLSATPETVESLSRDLGFQFYPSPRGYDHLIQLSMIGRHGDIVTQVYGIDFPLPSLVEPLKHLVLNRAGSAGHLFAGIADRVRLFCTVYNPATGRYEFDNSLFIQIAISLLNNSLFIQIAISLLIVLSVAVYLVRELRRARNR